MIERKGYLVGESLPNMYQDTYEAAYLKWSILCRPGSRDPVVCPWIDT